MGGTRRKRGDRQGQMTFTCMIIDDERPAREELAYLLSQYDDIEIIGQADSVSGAVRAIRKNRPDFIFLDIRMPGRNGFDLIPDIKDMPKPPLVVFVTAYDRYAVKAFEKNAVDYIMKPFSQARLAKSLARIRETLRLKSGGGVQKKLEQFFEKTVNIKAVKRISVERRGRILLLDPADVVFFRYNERKVAVHTATDTYTLYGIHTLDHLAENLAADQFFRTHRNTIVNLNHIREFSPWFNGKYNLTMADKKKTELILTRDRVKLFKRHLGI